MTGSAPPGWYPIDPKREQWWDGAQWTRAFRPARPATSAQQVGGFVLGLLWIPLCILVALLVLGFVFASTLG